jgi:hypothetical protein
MAYPGSRIYPEGVTVTVPTENRQLTVRMTPSAVEALRELPRRQAESVARAIAEIGHAGGRPVVAPPDSDNGRQYYAMVPADADAPVVMYREVNSKGYLVTALVDRATYKTYEIAERPGFLQSNNFKTAAAHVVAAAIGVILGARPRGGSS